MGTGVLGVVLHVPARTLHARAHRPMRSPRLSKASCSFSDLVPEHAEVGSVCEQPHPNMG